RARHVRVVGPAPLPGRQLPLGDARHRHQRIAEEALAERIADRQAVQGKARAVGGVHRGATNKVWSAVPRPPISSKRSARVWPMPSEAMVVTARMPTHSVRGWRRRLTVSSTGTKV